MTPHKIFDWTPAVVVFDCDGTLMDTERHWQAARDRVLAGHGVSPDPHFAELAKGVHYTECGQLMANFARRPELAEEMTGQLLQAFRQLVADHPVASPGAERMVTCAARFAPLAVASNCPRDVVESCLESAGLLGHFEQIVVPGDGIAPKPAPDVYLRAVHAFGAEPVECLAVEDSHCGLVSAAGAGLRVIGVGRCPTDDMRALADLWVTTLADSGLLAWADGRMGRQMAV